ncbi:hypothetical protein ACQEU3_47095 [Spirillospora sp. CA-253888]
MTTSVIEHPEALAQRLAAGTAPALAAAVHYREADRIAALLADLTPYELRGLAVVLANLVCIDDVAVERAVRGEDEMLTWPERAAAVTRLVARGKGASEVALQLHVSGATARKLLDAGRFTPPQRKQTA